MDPDTIWNAIYGQESNSGQNNRTSVTGAVGPGQIQPGTFAQYAQPGEDIHNNADNIAVSKRIVHDYYNRYNGDPSRIATAYFSGPDNVAPADSPTAWIKDKHDPNRKYVSSYVSDIQGQLDKMPQVDPFTEFPTAAPSGSAPTAENVDPFKEFPTVGGTTQVANVPLPQARPAQAPVPTPAGPETQSQALNRWMAENQGNTLAQGAARLGIGGLRGLGDVSDTIAQGIATGGPAVANLLAAHGVITPETAQSVSQWGAGVNRGISADDRGFQRAANGSTLADIGRVGGQIAGTAPLLGPAANALAGPAGAGVVAGLGRSAVQGAALGAGATALTSAASDQPLLDQIKQGAGAGALLGPAGMVAGAVGSKAAGLITGAVDPDVAQLAKTAMDKFGINVTPMQLAGNNSVLRFMQSVLQRTPFTGFGPAARAQQSDWESALIKEMGQTGDKVTPQVIDKAQKDLGSQYTAINKSLGTIPADQGFLDTLNGVKKDTDFSRVKNVIDTIQSKIDPKTGFISAADHQEIMRTNGPLDKILNNPDSSVVGDAKQIKGALDDVLKRTDPKLFAARKEVDYKYSVMKALDKASSDSPTGGLSPNKVFNAFKDYNQGDQARNATQLGQIGNQFITEPPSSGTFERLLTGGLGVAGAAGLGTLGYHEMAPDAFSSGLLKGGAGLAGLLALRYGASPLLRSNALSGSMVRNALGAALPNKLGNLIGRTAVPAAALTYRSP